MQETIAQLVEAAKVQVQANRFAFLRRTNNKRIVQDVINQATILTQK